METAMVGPTVKVFTAGEHFGNSDLSGNAEEFVQQLLNRSGYTKEYCWECRVDKLRHCSSESRPIRVIGFKSYGVVLRVKPYLTAAVDHQMTLYIPEGSGYSAKNLFEQLRANEKSISRVIRQKGNEKENTVNTTQLHAPIQPAPAPALPAATTTVKIHEPEEYRPEFKTLQGVVKNNQKLKYVLQKIQVVNNYNFCRNKVQFTETLRHECKWDKEGHSKGAVGRVLTELVKKDYLMETINERNKLVGYTLTEKGYFFIEKAKDMPSPPPSIPPLKKEEPKVDISAILVNMRGKLQELADVANKIASNNAQKVELVERIARLDQENEELSKILHQNKEAQEALSKLGNLISPLPIQGLRSTEVSALHS